MKTMEIRSGLGGAREYSCPSEPCRGQPPRLDWLGGVAQEADGLRTGSLPVRNTGEMGAGLDSCDRQLCGTPA